MTSPKQHIPSLDGLRFFAAFFVMAAHYTHWIIEDQKMGNSFSKITAELSGMGMSLFFVLSGFVIHYNYHHLYRIPQGVKYFFVARFSRLYPLFFILMMLEITTSFYNNGTSCGHAGDRWGLFLALPYHLTLTQSWFYSVICQKSLIYQYHMVSGISWSLSIEVFFYVTYLLLVTWLVAQKNISKQLLIALGVQLLLLGYLFCCWHFETKIDHVGQIAFGPVATAQHGYEDSLLRWLYYFNPLVNFPGFLMGAIAANIYLGRAPLTVTEKKWAGWLALISVALFLEIHLWFYNDLAPEHNFIGKTASLLYTPLAAILIFTLARYPQTLCSRFIGSRLLVKLGEASYSLYLWHAILGWFPRDFYYLHLNPWVLYVLAMLSVIGISRLSYLYIERPAQRYLRTKLFGPKTIVI